jgi:hypothetical protein
MGRKELDQQCGWQPDDVQVVAIDPLHETSTETLDRVAARAAEPFLRIENPLDLGIPELSEGDAGDRVVDNGEVGANEAHSADNLVGATCKLSKHPAGLATVTRLAIDPASEMNGRVDSERYGILHVNGAGFALGVVTNELDRLCIVWVMLLEDRADDVERDLQLQENRTSLRRRRSEDERLGHRRFSATQISSLGHLRAHSTENAS